VAASLLLSANLNIMYAGSSGFAKRHLLLPSPGPVPCTHVLIGDASLIVLSGREPSSAKFIRDSGLIMDSWIYGQSAWVVARGYISRLDGRHGRDRSSTGPPRRALPLPLQQDFPYILGTCLIVALRLPSHRCSRTIDHPLFMSSVYMLAFTNCTPFLKTPAACITHICTLRMYKHPHRFDCC
jgi:hypothetical protein